jgi:hypothetical protein
MPKPGTKYELGTAMMLMLEQSRRQGIAKLAGLDVRALEMMIRLGTLETYTSDSQPCDWVIGCIYSIYTGSSPDGSAMHRLRPSPPLGVDAFASLFASKAQSPPLGSD